LKRGNSTILDANIVIDKTSKVTPDEEVVRYYNAEYFAMLGHAISGGIESPLQFLLQVK